DRSHDRGRLRTLLAALAGQPVFKLELSRGGELSLHAGESVPYVPLRLSSERRGSWLLGSRASAWRLLTPASGPAQARRQGFGKAAAALTGKAVVSVLPFVLPGSVRGPVTAVQPEARSEGKALLSARPYGGFGLSVVFSGGANLLILPALHESDGGAE